MEYIHAVPMNHLGASVCNAILCRSPSAPHRMFCTSTADIMDRTIGKACQISRSRANCDINAAYLESRHQNTSTLARLVVDAMTEIAAQKVGADPAQRVELNM